VNDDEYMMMLHEAAHVGTAGSVGVSTTVSKDRLGSLWALLYLSKQEV
jgi:hypothetical protein